MSRSVVGVPKEIKDMEGRASMQPEGVAELVHHGHEVVVESGAGRGGPGVRAVAGRLCGILLQGDGYGRGGPAGVDQPRLARLA